MCCYATLETVHGNDNKRLLLMLFPIAEMRFFDLFRSNFITFRRFLSYFDLLFFDDSFDLLSSFSKVFIKWCVCSKIQSVR